MTTFLVYLSTLHIPYREIENQQVLKKIGVARAEEAQYIA
jgi:hypothetical protein